MNEGGREPDAIYQKGVVVAQVKDAEVDEAAHEVRFGEVTDSDLMLLPDECEFGPYRLLVRKIASAARVTPGAVQLGRILKGVTAEILGYREQ